jgi:hypothetical protein
MHLYITYLFEICREQQETYTGIIFIGDIIDNHYSSYHESDPDGIQQARNYRAIDMIKDWYRTFQ